MTPRVQQLIDTLHLQPHPEGGFYRETFHSPIHVQSPVVNAPRAAMTDIYFLLSRGQVSRFHRVAHDELWNFYDGEPLKLWHYDAETQQISSFLLGPPEQAEGFKYVIPAGDWQAAEPVGEYTLVGCTVAPGFDFHDFRFIPADSDIGPSLLAQDSTLQRLL